jgi:hypothetical protein
MPHEGPSLCGDVKLIILLGILLVSEFILWLFDQATTFVTIMGYNDRRLKQQ